MAAASQRWRTVGGSAPGFDQPDVKSRSTAILSTTDLKYLDQKGDWMQFEYAAADGTRPRVWLAKANVTQGDAAPSTGSVITFRKETGASPIMYGQSDAGGNPRCPTC